MRHKAIRLPVVALLLALSLILMACGDDDDAEESSSAQHLTTSTALSANGEQSGLTASFRGVTEDSIKVGIVYADFAAIREMVSIDLDHGSYEDAHRALIDEINSNGGVLGRQIEPVFSGINPVLDTDTEAACVKLAQDEDVFIVTGNILDDQPLCYLETNDTAFIGTTQTNAHLERANAPWYSGLRNADESTEATVSGFMDRGLFDGATVAVVAVAADQLLVDDVVIPLLDNAGIEITDTSIITAPPADPVATAVDVDVIIERHLAANVDLVLVVGQASVTYPTGLERSTFRPQILSTSLSSMRAYIRDGTERDLSVLDGAIAGNAAEQQLWWADPEMQGCIDIVEAYNAVTIIDPNTREAGEPENIVSVATACRNLGLMVALLEAAGPDLTNNTLADAGETLGEFHVPGQGDANYRTGGPDGDVPIYFYEWDDELQDLRPDGTTL
ncbi:MAG: ABC transporter substrate-binding protein [Acidobacteria bacterium]|nr:ABC transporter substrate-binding protein [Acidobacteriota bacterium]